MRTRQLTTSLARRRAATVAAATVAAVLPWMVFRATGGELNVATGGRPTMTVELPMVVLAALGVSLAGWGVLALLERRTDRARRVWTGIAVAVLLLSLAPLPTAEAATGTRIALALMHGAVGAVLIPGLRASAPGVSSVPSTPAS